MRRAILLLAVVVCLSASCAQGKRSTLGVGSHRHGDCGGWVWRFQQAYKLANASNAERVAGILNTLSSSAPANGTPSAWYFGTNDVSNGLPGSFDGTKNKPQIYTTADVAGYQDFPTLNVMVGYLMWLGQQPSFMSLFPLLRNFAWTDYAFYKARGDRDGLWRFQLQWKFDRISGTPFTLANNTGISQAGLINITQFAPVKPLSYMVADDGAFWIHMGGRLPPNWDIAAYWDFDSQDDLNSFLKYLSTAQDYEEGNQILNSTIAMAYRVNK